MTPTALARAIRRLPPPCARHPWRFDEARSELAAAQAALAAQRAEVDRQARLLAAAAQRRPSRRRGHDPRQLGLPIPEGDRHG